MAADLALRYASRGLAQEVKQLLQLDWQLQGLLGYKNKFNIIDQIASGRALLIGEGNLSFALSLANMPSISAGYLIATTYESSDELSQEATKNADKLRKLGVTVLHGIDATQFRRSFGSWPFDTILFQFPHVGSREPIEGRNPNFILVRDFLVSAVKNLRHGGKVLISSVDSPHYHGAFQFDEAAEYAGYEPPVAYPFDPNDFPNYEHTMTHEHGSALDGHRQFLTWVFVRK